MSVTSRSRKSAVGVDASEHEATDRQAPNIAPIKEANFLNGFIVPLGSFGFCATARGVVVNIDLERFNLGSEKLRAFSKKVQV